MLLLAIMGTDVVQLESRLVEEDLLLCNIKHEAAQGGCANSSVGAPGSFWHHVRWKLIGLSACLEKGQGQALV